MTKLFNDSTFSFGGAVAGIREMTVRVGGAKVDCTSIDDVRKIFAAGFDDIEITLGLVGGTPIARRTTGTATVVWADGSTGLTLSNAIAVETENTGRMDGEITSRVTIAPGEA